MKKERPILFSTPMVQAILAGRKTQTRRIVKPQPTKQGAVETFCKSGAGSVDSTELTAADMEMDELLEKCPYGAVGDLLWVRETFALLVEENHPWGDGKYWYAADGGDVCLIDGDGWTIFNKDGSQRSPWKPSIHMPKSAARIWLEIMDIRVERLDDISENDAKAEGLAQITKDNGRTWKYGIPDKDGLPGTDNSGWPWGEWEVSPVVAYKKLWAKINGQELTDSNPWCWCLTFKILSVTGKPETL